MEKEIEIGKLYEIYKKYGDLGFEIDTPYGYKKIEWCGITEENADVYRCELENGLYIEGADYHRIKKEDNEFIPLKLIKGNEIIQTRHGNFRIKYFGRLNEKATLYDVQVSDVHQYYSNDIVSHNTSFSIDAPLFLFFGKTTKTDKNEEIFNQYSESDTLLVRGMIEIDDEELIIERKMSRKLKKDGTWQINNILNYYRILPDGEEVPMNEDDSVMTTSLIQKTIGTEEDFMMTILATAKNLEDLIDSSPTEKGKLITRFVGLEVIEEKEEIARKLYNNFAKSMKSNIYNIVDLNDEIVEHETENVQLTELQIQNEEKLKEKKAEIEDYEQEKEVLLKKKQPIDEEILKLSPSRIKESISKITKDGIVQSKELEKIKKEITDIGEINFDEDKYHKLTKKRRELEKEIDKYDNEKESLEQHIKALENGEICPTCKRKLDNVDNSNEIRQSRILLAGIEEKKKNANEDLTKTNTEINSMEDDQQKSYNKAKLELQRDKIEIDLASMRNELKSLKNDQKRYELNLTAIEFNKKIESDILGVNAKIQMANIDKEKLLENIQKIKSDIAQNIKDIETKREIINKINKELLEEKIYKTYIEMVGKKGISKIVLRSVLPIINSELHRLLDEVTDFEVEMRINDMNNVEFYMIKDGVTKKLKSGSGLERTAAALALRIVLGQISTLPKLNFIAFDEVLGKVADENLDTIRLLFDKAGDFFETIFIISHINIVRDWADKIILIEKVDNISKISLK